MEKKEQLQQIRRFNRLVTQRVGALEANYLSRGRPLGEARLIFETDGDGVDVRALRLKLGLDFAISAASCNRSRGRA